MRIKFRYWDPIFDQMHPVRGLHGLDGDRLTVEYFIPGERSYFCPARNGELMQACGFYDVTGKDVYEEDIIEIQPSIVGAWPYYRVAGSCIWDALDGLYCSLIVQLTDSAAQEGSYRTHHGSVDDISSTIRVIGNIFENPELMQKKKGCEDGN